MRSRAFATVVLVGVVLFGTVAATPVPASPPSITGFQPGQGFVGTGVTINGSGFTGTTGVSFGGTATKAFVVRSDARIVAHVPDGAITGPIGIATPAGSTTSSTRFTIASPIQHVVILDQENHSFDNILGRLCAAVAGGTIAHAPCDGATTGFLSDGSPIPLATATDLVPDDGHSVHSQRTAINGGAMNGFSDVNGCEGTKGYPCYTQFDPSQIPNATNLAGSFALSDRTFEFASTPSWGGHLVLGSAGLDGFSGDNPLPSAFHDPGKGWGCDSYMDTTWWSGTAWIVVPSCIPDSSGAGPYRASPVRYVPTIFERLDAAGFSWHIYGGTGAYGSTIGNGYGWTICPSFAECLNGPQRQNLVAASQILTDAAAGTLPSLSIVTPVGANSQHNMESMVEGDDWIGQVVGAVMNGPEWSSTAVLLTWDDCGCFYDHVPPPQASWGIRVPMIIISPFARPGYTDSRNATFMSMMAFTEHNFGLAPLAGADRSAYDYLGAFNFGQAALKPIRTVREHTSPAERAWIAAHPPPEDDPT